MLRSNDNRDKAEINVQKSILGDMDNNGRNKEFRNGSEKFEEVRKVRNSNFPRKRRMIGMLRKDVGES